MIRDQSGERESPHLTRELMRDNDVREEDTEMADELNPNPINTQEPEEEWSKWYWAQFERVEDSVANQTDSFDKAMLTLSSAALGVSLAFIKDVVPLSHIAWKPTLLLSWIAFALCIIVTVISFRVSIRGHKQRRELLDEIYAKKNRTLAQNLRTSSWSKILTGCTWIALFLFLAGLVLTVIFVVKNVSSTGSVEDLKSSEAATAPCKEVRNYFMSDSDKVQKVPEPDFTRGRQIPKFAPAPTPQPPVIPQKEQ